MNDFAVRVGRRFDAAASRYDAHSTAQRQAAAGLARRIALPAPSDPSSLSNPLKILEIGCGTGHLTEQLIARCHPQHPQARLLVTDIAPAMVAACRMRFSAHVHLDFAVMDARHLATRDRYDLICGNLVAQWFEDLPAACANLAARLKPGGTLLLSLPGEATFQEWKMAHQALGLDHGIQPLPSPARGLAALPAGNNRMETEYWHDQPGDGIAFLRGLRAIGADTPLPGHTPLSPRQLRSVLQTLGSDPVFTYQFVYLEHQSEK